MPFGNGGFFSVYLICMTVFYVFQCPLREAARRGSGRWQCGRSPWPWRPKPGTASPELHRDPTTAPGPTNTRGEAPPAVPEYQGRAREYLGGVLTARALLQTQATGVHREADEVFEGPCSPTARTTGTQIYPAINSFSPLCTVPIKYQYFVKLHLIYAFYLTVYRYMYQRDILSKSVFFSLSLPPTNQMLLLLFG